MTISIDPLDGFFSETLLPPDSVVLPLSDVVPSDDFTPRLLALISNALVWRESSLLRREFDLGTNDWRVISALAISPGATATYVSDFVAMNKAVVSKAVTTLIARNLIVPTDGPRGSRPLYLTQAGAEMHDLMKPISMRGEEIIHGDLSADEVVMLRSLLRRLLLKTPDLSTLTDP
jgi:DNA-binding MarR family transcriptional regulator